MDSSFGRFVRIRDAVRVALSEAEMAIETETDNTGNDLPNESFQHGRRIRQNFSELVETICPHQLIDILYARKVITIRERETIDEQKGDIKMNQSLLSIIARKSAADFEIFRSALREVRQDHVAQLLAGETMEAHDQQTAQQNVTLRQENARIVKHPEATTNRSPQQRVQRNMSTSLPVQLQKLEKTLQCEISLKLTTPCQRKLGSSNDVFLMCLQIVLKESHDAILDMRKKQEAHIKAKVQEQEAEAEKTRELDQELQFVKKMLVEETKQRIESEKHSTKTYEMYQHMKKELQKQIKESEMKITLTKFQIDELNSIIDKEKRLRGKAEEDLLQERRVVQLFKQQLEAVKKEELKRHRNEMGLSTEGSVEKKVSEEFKETRPEVDLITDENHRFELAIVENMNDLKEENDRSVNNNRLFMDMLRSLAGSVSDCYRIVTDHLNIATKKIMDLEKKLSLFEKRFESLGMKVAGETRWASDTWLTETLTTSAAKENKKGISGIVVAEQGLYITNFQTSEISVYDLSTLVFVRAIAVDDLVNAYDMAYCTANRCLYIMDSKLVIGHPKNIFQFDLNSEILQTWTTQLAYGCISVAFDSNIVLTPFNENRLIEFTPNGELVREIQLSKEAGIGHPRHAMKLRNGHFLVSHGDRYDPLHRICVIDTSANVIEAFGGEPGSNRKSLNVPIYMAMDSNGSILLIDRENNRVFLLDSYLKFKRVIIPKSRKTIIRPERMVLDESAGRLFVAHNDLYWEDCRVFVFKFRTK